MGIWEEVIAHEIDADKACSLQSADGKSFSGQMICPQCGQAELDYDALLNLRCPACGYVSVGSFT